MSELSSYKRFYFLGIGGIGMSAISRYFKAHGFEVAGYDRTPSDLTRELEQSGIRIHYEDSVNNIPEEYKNPSDTFVILTPAIPKDHKEWAYFKENGFNIQKRAQVLAMLTLGKTAIAVAGTHGKTSTCAIISHILKTAHVPFFGFLGGIASNYKTNYFQPESDKADLVVVEADEFDRSFLRLHPHISIVTAVESDHLDIYGTFEELKKAYQQYADQTEPAGKLLLNETAPLEPPADCATYRYGIGQGLPVSATNIRVENNRFRFDAQLSDRKLPDIEMGVPGIHNIENALAAMEALCKIVTDSTVFYKALKTFRGVHRRFEVVLENSSAVLIDDYAHHPTEISATLHTVRQLYPDKKVLGIFQPHLFSRTKDLAQEFAESLSMLDEIILLPIYPARELPMPGVTSKIILEKIKNNHKRIVEKSEIAVAIRESDADVIVTIGAGDIDRLVEPLKEILQKRKG